MQTYDTISPSFPLHRCPLSPLLFILAIEPLALWLQSEAGFKGITHRNSVHKVSLYADDLLLYVSDCSLPVIFDILDQYEAASGYKLNYQKSELPISALARELPHTIAPFKWFSTLGYLCHNIFIGLFLKLFFAAARKNGKRTLTVGRYCPFHW